MYYMHCDVNVTKRPRLAVQVAAAAAAAAHCRYMRQIADSRRTAGLSGPTVIRDAASRLFVSASTARHSAADVAALVLVTTT